MITSKLLVFSVFLFTLSFATSLRYIFYKLGIKNLILLLTLLIISTGPCSNITCIYLICFLVYRDLGPSDG